MLAEGISIGARVREAQGDRTEVSASAAMSELPEKSTSSLARPPWRLCTAVMRCPQLLPRESSGSAASRNSIQPDGAAAHVLFPGKLSRLRDVWTHGGESKRVRDIWDATSLIVFPTEQGIMGGKYGRMRRERDELEEVYGHNLDLQHEPQSPSAQVILQMQHASEMTGLQQVRYYPSWDQDRCAGMKNFLQLAQD